MSTALKYTTTQYLWTVLHKHAQPTYVMLHPLQASAYENLPSQQTTAAPAPTPALHADTSQSTQNRISAGQNAHACSIRDSRLFAVRIRPSQSGPFLSRCRNGRCLCSGLCLLVYIGDADTLRYLTPIPARFGRLPTASGEAGSDRLAHRGLHLHTSYSYSFLHCNYMTKTKI